MGIRFVLFVNKQGQTRLAQYFEHLSIDERRALEGEIVRKCLARNDQQCSFVEHRNYKTVYRRYASLFFLVGVDNDELLLNNILTTENLYKREFNLGILMNHTDYIKLLVDKSAQGNHKISIDIPCSSSYGKSKCSTIFTDQAKAESVILENELAILEFIHLLVETMDRHFGNVCELDIMFHLEKVHFMLEEMVMNGCIVETSKTNILSPIQLMEKAS